MITFENWHEVRHKLPGFDQYSIINELLAAYVDHRVLNSKIREPKFSKCYYDKGWHLEFIEDEVDIYEYSFNCLRIYLTHNHQELENYQFFRSIDLFYKKLSEHFDINKSEWLKKMCQYAQESKHHKSPVFLENMNQYFEKKKIIKSIKCLIKSA